MADRTDIGEAAAAADVTQAEPSIAAKFLGEASAKADQHVAELSRKELATAEVAPEHVQQIPTAKEEEVPKVAEGDEERPTDAGIRDLGWSEDPQIPVP